MSVSKEEAEKRRLRALRFAKDKAEDPHGTKKFAPPIKKFAHSEKRIIHNKEAAIRAFIERKNRQPLNEKIPGVDSNIVESYSKTHSVPRSLERNQREKALVSANSKQPMAQANKANVEDSKVLMTKVSTIEEVEEQINLNESSKEE